MRIGILGANGKVGAELALLMCERHRDLEVVGLARSGYSTVLLEMAGIPIRLVDFGRPETMAQALSDCDLVIDLTYPSGQTHEIPAILRRMVEAVMTGMRPGASYVYASSVSAFGMSSSSRRMGERRIARTPYARIKRQAEKFVLEVARTYRIVPYLFRLGQTHGYLQSVTADYLGALALGSPRFVVTCFSADTIPATVTTSPSRRRSISARGQSVFRRSSPRTRSRGWSET